MAISHREIEQHKRARAALADPETYIPEVNSPSDASMLFMYLGNDTWAAKRQSGHDMSNYECKVRFAISLEDRDVYKVSNSEIDAIVKKYMGAMRTKSSHFRNAIKLAEGRELIPLKMLYRGWRRHTNKINVIIDLGYTENESRRAIRRIMGDLMENKLLEPENE
jgi:hypothetical protein